MTDREIVKNLIDNDQRTIRDFFFVRCRPMLIYIGQYYLKHKHSPEELIGEFYEFLSANDWHKLRIFQYSCTLNSYVTIIASRYFQHKRDKNTDSLDGDISIDKNLVHVDNDTFLMKDLQKIIKKMYPQVPLRVSESGVEVIAEDIDSGAINRALVLDGVNVRGLTAITDNMEDYFIQRMGGNNG